MIYKIFDKIKKKFEVEETSLMSHPLTTNLIFTLVLYLHMVPGTLRPKPSSVIFSRLKIFMFSTNS